MKRYSLRLSNLFRLFGFTPNEQKVLLFLIAGFFVGLVVRMYQGHWAPLPLVSIQEPVQGLNTVSGNHLNDTNFDKPQGVKKNPAITMTKSDKLDINSATKEEFENLPGIGPTLAERIILYRDKNSFQKVDDLLNIKGIGLKKFEKIKSYIYI